jgi:hypothetical protein
MNEPSERLDALLEQWQTGQHDQQIRVGSRLPSLSPAPGQGSASGPLRAVPPSRAGDAELRELLETAQRVQTLPTLKPSAEFSARLGEELQTRAQRLRAQQRMQSRITFAPGRQTTRKPFLTPGWMRVHPAWAAVVLFFAVLGMLSLLGVIGAQADSPSNPFYSVKLLEQNVQLSLASPADKVRLHIQYAQDALAALKQHTAPGDASNYTQLLAHLDDEIGQASSALSAVPAGDEQNQLTQQLADLKTSAQTTLRGLLGQLTLAERLATTTELGKLGAAVPSITSVTVTAGDGQKATVVITGSGFEPGATLLIDGQPSDASIEVSSTQVKAVVTLPPGDQPGTFGVSNPDGTVAQSNQITLSNAQPTPSATAEPTKKPGEGNTPTPTPTPGGEGHGTPTPTPGQH